MTSLRGSLPPAGSTLWQKERRSSSFESSPSSSSSLITHIVIREVWKKAIPSPHALYKIDVMTKSNHWFVLKRYREFCRLHKQLVASYAIPKDMLPPKKLTSNLSLKHLEQRRDALEHYLQRLVNSSTYVSSSPEILEFLDVGGHDVMAVTKTLAKELLLEGDKILADGGSYTFTLTQLYCITRQLQLPEPMHLSDEQSPLDLGHLYSFVYNLEELCVCPNKSRESQELVSHLEFDISLFKALRSLKIDSCPVYLMKGLDSLQSQLKYLAVRHSLKTMRELLVDKVVGRRKTSGRGGSSAASWRSEAAEKFTKNRVIIQPWVQLTNVTLSHNKLTLFDDSLKLLPALQSLDLRHNEFVTLDLTQMNCPSLTHLDVSHNSICSISGNSRNLPNLKSLILSYNNLENLSCLETLCGLIELDLTANRVGSLKELRSLSSMSQLRYLSVDGNPLTKVKSYRVQIFSFFCGHKIMLDNKPRTADEESAKNVWPTRSRSLSTPDTSTNEDSEQIVRLMRRNTYEASSSAVVDDDDECDDDDDDSGIEGFTPSRTNADHSGNNDQSQDQGELEFNWSYFDFLDFRQPEIFSSTAGMTRELEERIREDMCEKGTSTNSTESASEVVVSGESTSENNNSDEENPDSELVALQSISTSTPVKATCEDVSSGRNLETNRSGWEEERERIQETSEECDDILSEKTLDTSKIEREEEEESDGMEGTAETNKEFSHGRTVDPCEIEREEEREEEEMKETRRV